MPQSPQLRCHPHRRPSSPLRGRVPALPAAGMLKKADHAMEGRVQPGHRTGGPWIRLLLDASPVAPRLRMRAEW